MSTKVYKQSDSYAKERVSIVGNVSGDNHTFKIVYDMPTEAGIWAYALKYGELNGTYTFSCGTKSVKRYLSFSYSKPVSGVNTTSYCHAESNTISIPYPWFYITGGPAGAGYKINTYGSAVSFYDIKSGSYGLLGGYLNGSAKGKLSVYDHSKDVTITEKYVIGSGTILNYDSRHEALERDFTLSANWCNNLPSAESGMLTCTVNEYFGSYLWATHTVSASVYVPYDYKPTISSVVLSDFNTTVPRSWNAFVQNYSNVGISSIQCSAPYSASITKYEILCDASTNDGSSQYSNVHTGNFKEYGNYTVTVRVTDSRGRQAEKSANISILEYSSPVFNSVQSERCTKDGTLDNDGTYILSAIRATYSSCAGKNKLKLTVQYRPTDAYTYGSAKEISANDSSVIANGDIDTDKSYDVRYVLSDQFNTIVYIDYVSTAVYLMHFKKGGRGVAFGGMSTVDDTVDFSFDALFRGDVKFTKSDGSTVSIKQIISKLGL